MLTWRVKLACLIAFAVIMFVWAEIWTWFVYSLSREQTIFGLGVFVGWVVTSLTAWKRPHWFTGKPPDEPD